MKSSVLLFCLVAFALVSCSKDDDATPKVKLNHVGEKWNITSVDFTIVDQSLDPTKWVQNGTAKNAGAFYFNGDNGSFNILINGKRQEEYFGATVGSESITIVDVDQSFSTTRFSQSVIAITGSKNGNSMTLSGTFTKQNILQQYVFTGSFVLTKE